MTASEFALIVRAKRIRRGKWLALCPAHGDHKPSMQISEGKQGVLLKCWSHNCSPKEICAALGMKVSDLFYETREMTPEAKQRLKDERRLEWLRIREMDAIRQQYFINPRAKSYWRSAETKIQREIEALSAKLNGEPEKVKKMRRYVERHGWDRIWELWLGTEQGKLDAARYGI